MRHDGCGRTGTTKRAQHGGREMTGAASRMRHSMRNIADAARRAQHYRCDLTTAARRVQHDGCDSTSATWRAHHNGRNWKGSIDGRSIPLFLCCGGVVAGGKAPVSIRVGSQRVTKRPPFASFPPRRIRFLSRTPWSSLRRLGPAKSSTVPDEWGRGGWAWAGSRGM